MKMNFCPSRKIVIILLPVLVLIFFICFACSKYDGQSTWMDWANLIVNAVGTIFLTIYIYWVGSVRADKIRDKDAKKEIVNRLFSEYARFSQKLLFTVGELKKIRNAAMSAKTLLENEKMTQQQFVLSWREVSKYPSPLIHFNLEESEFSFIANDMPTLYMAILLFYEKIYNLEQVLKKYEDDAKENLGLYREVMKGRGGNLLTFGIITDKEILTLFVRSIDNLAPAIEFTECCIYVLSKALSQSFKYSDQYFKNEITLNSEKTNHSFFSKILNYKFEFFDATKESID